MVHTYNASMHACTQTHTHDICNYIHTHMQCIQACVHRTHMHKGLRNEWNMILFHRWSHDGKYFARLSTDRLSVYETSVSVHMSLLYVGLI